MFRVQVHKHTERIFSLFYRMHIWHREDEETVTERTFKLFYSIFYCLFPLSLIAGAFASDNMGEFVFLVESSILSAVSLIRLLYVIWRKNEILDLINRICDYGVKDEQTFSQTNDKLNIFMKFSTAFVSLVYFCGISMVLVIPFLSTERTLFFNIGFPLDWKNNEFAYWMAFTFVVTQVIITAVSLLFPVIVWYLMASCGWRYVALGQQIRDMGKIKLEDATAIEMKISNAEIDNLYQRDLIEAIVLREHLEE